MMPTARRRRSSSGFFCRGSWIENVERPAKRYNGANRSPGQALFLLREKSWILGKVKLIGNGVGNRLRFQEFDLTDD